MRGSSLCDMLHLKILFKSLSYNINRILNGVTWTRINSCALRDVLELISMFTYCLSGAQHHLTHAPQ